MTSRWSSLRANRPYQQAGMSVEVYYHQFCDWKDEIDREGHQCSEASLIEHFISRMTWDLLVRMYGYPSPPFSLSEAFKRAQFEESIISLEELTRQIGANKVFEEMFLPNPIDTAENQGAEEGKFRLQLKTNQQQEAQHHETAPARFEVGAVLIDEFGQQSPLKLEGAGATHNVFDKMPSLHSMKQNEGNDNTEDGVLPVVFLSQVKGSVVDIKEDESTNSSLKTELEEAFGDELKENLSSKLNHLGVNEESLTPLKIGDQYFGSEADFTTNMEICDQITLENETFNLFHEMLVSDVGKNMSYLAFIHTINLIKCKCKNRAPLSDNDVAFYFDPGGCTLSKMNLGTSEFCGEQGGLSLASGLAPNLADALVETISHEPCIMEAYGYGDVIEYSGTKKEFVGEGSTQNALMAWSPIDRDCEGQKIDHAVLRNVLDNFMVVPSKNIYEQSIRAACRLVWPRDRFLVQVLDDSEKDVAQLFLRNEVSSWEEKDVNIVYRHRNLKSATSQSYVRDYEFVAIIDADFQPNVGLRLVQAHWSFVNEDEDSLTRLQNIKLCVHFEVILVSFPFQISVLSSKNRRHWLYLFIDAALDEKCWKIYLQKSDNCVSSDLMQSVVPLSSSLELNHLRDGYRKRDMTLDDLSCGHLEFFIPFNTNNDCLISSPYNSKKEPLEALYLLMKQHDGIHHETMHTPGETESYEPLFIFGRLDVIEDVLKAGCNTLGLKVSYLIWVVKTLVMFWLINQKCQSGHTFKNLDSVCTYCLVECSKDPVKDINLLYFDEAWFLRIDNYEMPRSLKDCPKATSFRFDNIMVKVPYKQMIKAFYLFSWKHHLVLGREIVFVVAINVENFVWDPGQSVISIYILGDKDVFEREGKRMVCIGVMQWDMIMRYNEDFCVWCLSSLHGLVAATLAARVTLKDNSRATEVLANMKSVCDWNNVSAKVKGFPWGDVLYDAKAFDSWRHFLDDIVLAAIFENFVWDPGLYMLL